MMPENKNRFDDFFGDHRYVSLKNDLYNYLLRKRAVERTLRKEEKDLVLEIGSGISPVMTSWDRMVYSDVSASAMEMLKRMMNGKGRYVVADAARLPFEKESFSHVICSEVLEHILDDRAALREINRVTKTGGALVATFPHRRCYFAHDDRFVHHYRRYELSEMISLLEEAGFRPVDVQKVLGPLEKITMLLVTAYLSFAQNADRKENRTQEKRPPGSFLRMLFKSLNVFYAGLARLDAVIMPRVLSTVLLIKAKKVGPPAAAGRFGQAGHDAFPDVAK